MEIQIGQVVTSRAGRDVGGFYVVAAIESERLLLVNGLKWPLASPKRKNIRHINPTTTALPGFEAATDETLRAALAAYAEEHGPGKGG